MKSRAWNAPLFAVLAAVILGGCASSMSETGEVTSHEEIEQAAEAAAEVTSGQIAPAVAFEDSLLAMIHAPDGAPTGWPAPAAFKETYEAGLPSFTVTECDRVTLEVSAEAARELESERSYAIGEAMLVTGDEDSAHFVAIHAAGQRLPWWIGDLKLTDLNRADGEGAHRFHEAAREIELACHGARRTAPKELGEAYAAYVYNQVTLAAGEDLYIEPEDRELDEATRAELEALQGKEQWTRADLQRLIEIAPSDSWLWDRGLEEAKRLGEVDLTYQMYRRYRPVGRCSHDTRPIETKKEFASFCSKHGKFGCQLKLMTDLMAYRVQRVSDLWLGGKPVSYESPIEALDALVEIEPFMIGLLISYPTQQRTAGIRPHFFALGLAESDYAAPIKEALGEYLASGTLDPANAHRLALARFSLGVRSGEDASAVLAALRATKGVPSVTLSMLEEATTRMKKE